MKTIFGLTLIGILGIIFVEATDYRLPTKNYKTTEVAEVKIEWWQQFTKHHTVTEIVDAAYDAGYVYRSVNCSNEPSYYAYNKMTPLEKDMYFRIYSLGRTETQRCNIADNVGDYLL